MRVVLVTGPLGVGKTTLIEGLGRAYARRKAAVLDGDALSMTFPGGMGNSRLDLVEENLLSCAMNFRDWGAEYLFTAWIFARQNRLDHFVDRLVAQDMPVMVVSLCVSPAARDARLAARDRAHNFDPATQEWLRLLQESTMRLKTDLQIDTSGLTAYEVMNRVTERLHRWDALVPAHQ
jgi:dephospho-CoA kinase